jgi:hypothetical protein
MWTMPASAPARYGMNEYDVYVGDLTRRVGLLLGNGRNQARSRPGAYPPVRSPVDTLPSEFFED